MEEGMICSVIKEDYPHFVKIWERVVKETPAFVSEEEFEFHKKYRMPYYFNHLFLFAYKDEKNKIKGFLGVSQDRVEMLFIDPIAKGKGIGKKFMNFVFNNLKINKVDIYEYNKDGIAFFKHLGFKEIGRSELDKEGKNKPILSLEKSVP